MPRTSTSVHITETHLYTIEVSHAQGSSPEVIEELALQKFLEDPNKETHLIGVFDREVSADTQP